MTSSLTSTTNRYPDLPSNPESSKTNQQLKLDAHRTFVCHLKAWVDPTPLNSRAFWKHLPVNKHQWRSAKDLTTPFWRRSCLKSQERTYFTSRKATKRLMAHPSQSWFVKLQSLEKKARFHLNALTVNFQKIYPNWRESWHVQTVRKNPWKLKKHPIARSLVLSYLKNLENISLRFVLFLYLSQ